MARVERERSKRRFRVILAWVFTALIVGVYFALPEGEEASPLALRTQQETSDADNDALRLEILEVTPADASPGSAVTVTYVGADDASRVEVFAGKVPMEILARHEGSVVARVPATLPEGRVKLRAVQGSERSKPYDLRLKSTSWRKPFRNLIGGFALLIFGIGVLARGAREAAGIGSAHALARVAGRGPAALGLGAAVGALAQSTTAAAGLLAGLVASSLLAVGPAAIAFLGAELGAATAPLVTGLIDPREGLVVVAIGVLWHSLASDRRSIAFARLLLGAGLISLGLQTLRPGFELFVQDPSLLSLVARLNPQSVADLALCALLGALLVALLQGPAPVVVLVLVLAQTTAQWDLRTALAVLAGSGLGAGIGALVTTPAGRRCRRFAILNLLLGAASTLIAAATVQIWSHAADLIVPGVPHEMNWGKRVLLPNLGLHLGVAFALSQLASVFALMPIVPFLARWLERRYPDAPPRPLASVGDPLGVIRAQLANVLDIQSEALIPLGELVRSASRSAGRLAEHGLAEAHAALEELLIGPVAGLEDTSSGRLLARAAFTSLQLQRSLEGLHRQAERLVDSRVAASSGAADVEPLVPADAATLKDMHELLVEGLSGVRAALATDTPLDVELARAREIRMNGLEARTRGGAMFGSREALGMRSHLGVLELVDAYESAGNQVYRLAEALGESYSALGVERTG
jgi:hypothetical protein